MNTAPQRTVLEWALEYLARGIQPVPVPHRAKAPVDIGWPHRRYEASDLPEHFNGGPQNIGFNNGQPSQGRVDVDLDASEAITLAPMFLPRTASVFGRHSRPRSHWGYCVDSLVDTLKFQDVEKGSDLSTSLVEIRSTGSQTIAPPSVHPTGELIRWDEDGEPAVVSPPELRTAVAKLASAAILARHWPQIGQRHDCALAAGGFLINGGMDVDAACRFVECAAMAAGDEEWRSRGRDVRDTADTIRRGKPVTRGPRLAFLLRGEGDKVVAKIVEWLKLRPESEARQTEGIDASDRDLPRATAAAWEVLKRANETPWLFRHGDVPVRLERDGDGRPMLVPLTRDRLRYELARATPWFVRRKDGTRAAAPPLIIIDDMLASPELPLPFLRTITRTPVFDANMSLLIRPGYHDGTGILVSPPPPPCGSSNIRQPIGKRS